MSAGDNIQNIKSELDEQTVELVFPEPVVITGSEPVTLGIRLDLSAESTTPSFMVSIENASYLSGLDAINGAGVPIVIGDGDFRQHGASHPGISGLGLLVAARRG